MDSELSAIIPTRSRPVAAPLPHFISSLLFNYFIMSTEISSKRKSILNLITFPLGVLNVTKMWSHFRALWKRLMVSL